VYLKYFGLTERPFSIAPDPHYLYMSARHKEAMAHLSYGLSQGGCFIVLTGEVGTGKTTLCRNLLTDLPDNVDVSLILNANINEQELLQTICDELKIDHHSDSSQKQLLDQINSHLLATFADNRHTVLIIDEAQLLSRDVLESIRLLTNLETTKSKLLQIILIGQPELNDVLARNDLRQLAQRVTARYHLGPLERSEIDDYVNFRLGVAGCKQPLFSRQALTKLHKLSDGIPRKINVLADHALLSAYSKTQSMVDSKNVKQSAQEVFISSDKPEKSSLPKANRWWALAAALVALNIGLWWWFSSSESVDQHLLADNERPKVEQSKVKNDPAEPSDNTDASLANDDILSATSDEALTGEALTGVAPTGVASTSVVPTNEGQAFDGDGVASPESSKLGGEIAEGGDALTTIVRSDDVVPGSVVVSEEFLDESTDEGIPALALEPVTLNYDANTEFGRVLETSADITGRTAAIRNLSSAWDVDLPEPLIRSACTEVQEMGIVCLGINNWPQMLRFNRPTILVLEQRDQLHRVILFKIEDEQAQVLVGENVHTVSVEELRSRWSRKALALWRPGDVGKVFLQQGLNSPALPRVREQLNNALTQANMSILNELDSNKYDLEVAQKAFALQTRFGIVADGKIGNETYLLMNELVAPDATPVLQRRVP